SWLPSGPRAGMWACSATHSDSKPRSSAELARLAMFIEYSVGKNRDPEVHVLPPGVMTATGNGCSRPGMSWILDHSWEAGQVTRRNHAVARGRGRRQAAAAAAYPADAGRGKTAVSLLPLRQAAGHPPDSLAGGMPNGRSHPIRI